jgi:hypothetical protein
MPKLSKWFIERWGGAPENLPKLGLISCPDTRDLEYKDKAAGWIYHDKECQVGWIGWVVTNPDNSLSDTKYIDHLFDGLEMVAQNNNIKTLLYTTDKPSMMNLLEKRGFHRGDENITQLIKKL